MQNFGSEGRLTVFNKRESILNAGLVANEHETTILCSLRLGCGIMLRSIGEAATHDIELIHVFRILSRSDLAGVCRKRASKSALWIIVKVIEPRMLRGVVIGKHLNRCPWH